MSLDLQTNYLNLKSEEPMKYQVNDELGLVGEQYLAGDIKVSHGFTLSIIKASPR